MVQKSPKGYEFKAGLGWKTLCHPSSKWASFSNQGRIRQQKDRDELPLSSAVPKKQWASIPPLPLWLSDYMKPSPVPFK